jgi:outer membrane lipoprotein LolB
MRRRLLMILMGAALLDACVTAPVRIAPPAWDTRCASLQRTDHWEMTGRAAVAFGTQGWQASLNWRQVGDAAEVHLAGPLGIGALVVNQSPEGVAVNGGPPGADVLGQLQQRLGFDLPLANLRYWLLGVPDPGSAFELERNDTDRAKHLVQAGWSIDYQEYTAVNGDSLPSRLVLNREGVRVRVAADHWELTP